MNNCNELKDPFGFQFCFVHGTHPKNLPFIMKDKKLKLSSDMENENDIMKEFGGRDYVYCSMIFDDIKLKLPDVEFISAIIIDQKNII